MHFLEIYHHPMVFQEGLINEAEFLSKPILKEVAKETFLKQIAFPALCILLQCLQILHLTLTDLSDHLFSSKNCSRW